MKHKLYAIWFFSVIISRMRNYPSSASPIACNIESVLYCKFSTGAPSRFKVLIKLKFVVKPNIPLVSLVAPAFFSNAALIKCMTLKVSETVFLTSNNFIFETDPNVFVFRIWTISSLSIVLIQGRTSVKRSHRISTNFICILSRLL